MHFPIDGIKQLPAEKGTLLGWSGNAIHWGGACHRGGKEDPRTSVALVFRLESSVGASSAQRVFPCEKNKLMAMTVQERLRAVATAIPFFKHWYKVPSGLVSVLSQVPCLQDLRAKEGTEVEEGRPGAYN